MNEIKKTYCDLLPLDILGSYYSRIRKADASYIFRQLSHFKQHGMLDPLYEVLSIFSTHYGSDEAMFLELSEDLRDLNAEIVLNTDYSNCRPASMYFEAAIRHFLQYLKGDTDGPHDRAFVWNIMLCIFVCTYFPDLNDYAHVSYDED